VSVRLQSWETRAIGSSVAGSILRWVVGPGWEMVELIIAGGAEYFQSSSTALLLAGVVARSRQIVKTNYSNISFLTLC
jgi:hypothetical protein